MKHAVNVMIKPIYSAYSVIYHTIKLMILNVFPIVLNITIFKMNKQKNVLNVQKIAKCVIIQFSVKYVKQDTYSMKFKEFVLNHATKTYFMIEQLSHASYNVIIILFQMLKNVLINVRQTTILIYRRNCV